MWWTDRAYPETEHPAKLQQENDIKKKKTTWNIP